MTDAPERVHLAVNGGGEIWGPFPHTDRRAVEYIRADLHDAELAALREENRELAMQIIASDGQAHDAYTETLALRDRVKALQEALSTGRGAAYHAYERSVRTVSRTETGPHIWHNATLHSAFNAGWDAARAALKADQ